MTGIVCAIVGSVKVAAAVEIIRAKKGVVAVGNAQISTAQSKFGGASGLFDGTGDYLSLTMDAIGTGDFTIEFWFRIGNAAPNYVFATTRSPDGTNAFQIGMFESKINFATSGANIVSGDSNITTNTWHHYAVARSSGTTKAFLNGSQYGSTYSNDTYNWSNTSLFIARGLISPFVDLNGYIDEFRISNSARYTANFTPSTTPFVNDANTLLLLHMDGTDASTYFEDDNGQRAKTSMIGIRNAQIDTAQSKFGGASGLFTLTSNTADRIHLSPLNVIGTAFTIECWLRIGNFNFSSVVLAQDNGSSGSQGFQIQVPNSTQKVTFVYWTSSSRGSVVIVESSVTITTNTWYHVAVAWNGSTLNMYIDGTNRGSWSVSTMFQSTANIAIGGLYNSDSSPMIGWIDEVRFSNIARYTSNFTPSTTPFVNDTNTLFLTHLDGTDAVTVFTDDNGVRAPKGITALGNAQIDTAQSKFGGSSALFDGTGDYLSVITDTDLQFTSTESWTVELWFRTNTVSGADQRHMLAAYTLSGSFNGWGLKIGQGSGTDGITYFWDGVSWRAFNTTVATGTWYHVAVVSNAGSCKMYLNGTEQTTTFTATSSINNTSSNLAIGSRVDGSNSWNGWMDEIRISNTARYTANFTPSTTPFVNDANTVLLLHMDGTDASTVFVDDNGVVPKTL